MLSSSKENISSPDFERSLFMYYSSGNYEAFASPKKPEGVDNKSAYIVGSGLAALTAACYPGPRRPDEGRAHPHPGERTICPAAPATAIKFETWATSCAAAARWTTISSSCGICSVPSPPSKQRAQRSGRVLLAQQGRPELLPVPCNREPRSGRPHRRQVRHLRQGRHGDHEAVLHPERGPAGQEDHRLLR